MALGNFDGVHRGHHFLLHSAVAKSLQKKLVSIAWTFGEHPKNVLAGKCVTPQLVTRDVKLELMKKIGIDKVVFADFDKVKDYSCEEFVDKVLVEELSASHVFCGENYTFARKAEGDAEKLKELCEKRGISVTVLPLLQSGGETVSSTRIRKLIENGCVAEANLILAQWFCIRGKVVEGTKTGKKYGVPTVNMTVPECMIKPKNGVYFSSVMINGEMYDSVTNIGVRPTVDGKSENMETHIIGYHGNLYGDTVDVFLLKYHREEMRFNFLDELFEQIEKDIEERKQWKG